MRDDDRNPGRADDPGDEVAALARRVAELESLVARLLERLPDGDEPVGATPGTEDESAARAETPLDANASTDDEESTLATPRAEEGATRSTNRDREDAGRREASAEDAATSPGAPAAPPTRRPPPAEQTTSGARPVEIATTEELVRAPSASSAPRSAPAASVASRRARPSLERLVGVHLMAWVGAIIVVLAAGFFGKLAYDRGWIGAIPPAARALLIAAFGAVLLGVAAFAKRRFGSGAAAGAAIAGLGVLFLDAWLAHSVFQLVSPVVALVFLLVLAGLGVWLMRRFEARSIGVVAILAGYLGPLVVPASRDAMPIAFSLHLTALLAMAFGVASLFPSRFGVVRRFALPAHVVVGGVWLAQSGGTSAFEVLLFAAAWWAIVAVGGIVAVERGASGREEAFLGLSSTTLFVLVAAPVVYGTTGWRVGAMPFAVAIAAVLLAVQFGSGLTALRRRRLASLDRVTLALWLQAGVLLVVGIAMLLSSRSIVLAWLLLGVAELEAARRIRSRRLFWFALANLTLAAIVALLLVPYDLAMGAPLAEHRLGAFGLAFVPGAWYVLLAALAAFAVAFQVPGMRVRRRLRLGVKASLLANAVGIALVGVVLLHAATGVLAMAILAMLSLAFLAGAHAAPVRGRLADWRTAAFVTAPGIAALATAAWGMVSLQRLAPEVGPEHPILVNAVFGVGVAVLVTLIVTAVQGVRHGALRTSGTCGGVTSGAGRIAFTLVLVAGCCVLALALAVEASGFGRVEPLSAGVVARVSSPGFTSGWTIGIGVLLALSWFLAPPVGRRLLVGGVVAVAFGALLAVAKMLLVDLPVGVLEWREASWRFDALSDPVATSVPLIGGVAIGLWFAFDHLARHVSRTPWSRLRGIVVVVVAAIGALAIGVQFERVARATVPTGDAATVAMVLRAIATCAGATLAIWTWTRRRDTDDSLLHRAIEGGAMIAVGGWLTIGTLAPWLLLGRTPSPPIVSRTTLVGAFAGAVAWLASRHGSGGGSNALPRFVLRLCVAATVLWIGTIELNALLGDRATLRDGAITAWWATFGVAGVIVGFRRRDTTMRWFGLALVGIAAAKFLLFDLREANTAWRVASSLFVGLMMVGTSIVYVRAGGTTRADREHGESVDLGDGSDDHAPRS